MFNLVIHLLANTHSPLNTINTMQAIAQQFGKQARYFYFHWESLLHSAFRHRATQLQLLF